MIDIRTDKQKELATKYNRVAQCFDTLKAHYTDASDSKIIAAMARERVEGLTSVFGIRTALIRTGKLAATPTQR